MSPEAPRPIVNTWEQLKAAVAAKLLPKEHALAISIGQHGEALVWSPFFKTNPKDAAWYHHKNKAFFGRGSANERRRSAIAEAIDWARKTYGYAGAFVGNALRDQVPEIVQKKFPIKRQKALTP